VFVRPQRGVSAEVLQSRILRAGLDPDIGVQTPSQLATSVAHDIKKQLTAFWAAQRALVVVAFVAVLSTLLLVGVQRRRELATLVAVGMRSGQLGRMVVLEAGVVALVGAILGPLAGVGMFEASRQILPIFIGFHDPFHLDLNAILLYAPITVAVVLVASVLPAWRASRVEVIPALQYE
jgi:putative ABC transport system permease protein